MFFLGILSFIQIAFLPGFLIIKTFKNLKLNKVQILTYSFALSLLVNYMIVFLLTSLHVYYPISVYIFLSLEFLYLIFLIIRYFKKINKITSYISPPNILIILKKVPILNLVIIFIMLLIFLVYIVIFIRNLGTVFDLWDDIFSWNRWAVDWYNNIFPALTYEYPQLLPASWSISYTMIRSSEVQAFAKALMPIFSIYTILLFIDLGRIKKNLVYIVSGIFCGVIILALFNKLISTGYMELPITFFSTLIFYIFIINSKELFNFRNLIFINLFSCIAVLVKQSGLFILLLAIGYNTWFLYKKRKGINWKKTAIVILFVILMISLIILPWYIFKEFQIQSGQDLSNIRYVTQDIYQGKNLIDRLISAFDKYFISRSLIEKVLSIIMFVLLFSSIFKKESRLISIFVVYPYLLFWGFYFSYDHRNLAVLLPFLSFSCAYGLYFFIELIKGKWIRIGKYINFSHKTDIKLKSVELNGRKFILFFLISICILILIPSIFIKSDNLLNQQRSLQRKLGYSDLNNLIYDYKFNNKIDGQILTDYWFLGLLPEFKDNNERIAFPGVDCNKKVFDIFYDNNPFEKTNNNVNYYLLSDRLNPEYTEELNTKIAIGQYELIFEYETFVQEDNRTEKYKFIKIK